MGDQEFETQRRFLHKDPNNGSQDFFSLTFLLLCFILSFSWKEEEEEALMKLEILILALEDAHRKQTTEVRAISLFPRRLVELRCTDSVHGKQTSPLRHTSG